MPSLDMKKFLNKTIAVKTAAGVAASVTAMVAVNAAMPQSQAQDVVHHHAKEINDRSNLAAKILEIDKSILVQKNYLKAAQRIDDFLTGQTEELHLDSTMFDVDGSLDDESNAEVDMKANEAFNRVNEQLTNLISEDKNNDLAEVFDLSKVIKERVETDQNTNHLLSQMTGRRTDNSSTNQTDHRTSEERRVDTQSSTSAIESVHKAKNEIGASENRLKTVNPKDDIRSNEIPSLEKKSGNKVEQQVERKPDNKLVNKVDKQVEKQVEHKPDNKTVNKVEKRVEKRVEHSLENESKDSTKDQSSIDKINSLKVASAVEDYLRSNRSEQSNQNTKNNQNTEDDKVIRSDDSGISKESKTEPSDNAERQLKDSKSSTDKETDERDRSSESSEERESKPKKSDDEIKDLNKSSESSQIDIVGTAEISVHVRYNNNRTIADFKIIKKTEGVRFADGSEIWKPVTFDRSDLPKEFLDNAVWLKADLVDPEFSSSYTPTSEDFKVRDTLTMRTKTREEIRSDAENLESKKSEDSKDIESKENNNSHSRKSSRTINLRTPNGEILKTIVQSEVESEYEIPKTIDDWFVTETLVPYSEEDKDVVYQSRYETIEDIIDYSVTDTLDGRESTQKSIRVKSIKKVDNLKKQIVESNEELEARKIAEELESSYLDAELDSIEVNTIDKTVIRKYRSVEKVETVKPSNREHVNYVTDRLLASMPTVSNRAEYSKYTSVNDQFANLIERDVIERFVFELSEGSYDYQNSDKQIKPSKDTVSLLELNRRVTDRLIERINEYRRFLGLSEVTVQPLTLEQERMFASHAIYNYLANTHSSSKINDEMMKMVNLQRLETMQPVHKIKVSNQMLTPEAVADSLFRTILNETYSYVVQDGGETGHLEQLIDPDIKSVYAGMFIGSYEQVEQTAKVFGKSVAIGHSNEYALSTTLQYFK